MSFRPAVLGAVVATVAAVGLCCPATAGATPGLVDDSNVQGYLGFCDVNHQQVRSGLLRAAPFAWTTVSSLPAPAGYEKGKASIVAFQPRPQVDPIDWSGKQLNAASTFTNPKAPMASGTRIDSSFSDFTGTYKPKVDGLIQVRMYFTGVNKPQYAGSYPAVFVKVTGNRWTQVGGGAVKCAAGSSRSVELDSLPAARLKINNGRPSPQTAKQLRALAVSKAPKTSASGSATTGSGVGPTSTAGTGGGSIAARPAADASRRDSGSGTSWVWFGGAALIVFAAAGFVIRRRQLGRAGQ